MFISQTLLRYVWLLASQLFSLLFVCLSNNNNKCIGDDTKADARQSPNCILKNKNKIKYGEKRFLIWRMELLHPAMWHDHDTDFARWLHPAMWHVALESWHWIRQVAAPCNVACGSGMTSWNSSKSPPYWNSTSGFDFDHIIAFDMSFCTSLRNFIQIGPLSKNGVMSIFKMADLSHLGFYGFNNWFFKKPLYDFL